MKRWKLAAVIATGINLCLVIGWALDQAGLHDSRAGEVLGGALGIAAAVCLLKVFRP